MGNRKSKVFDDILYDSLHVGEELSKNEKQSLRDHPFPINEKNAVKLFKKFNEKKEKLREREIDILMMIFVLLERKNEILEIIGEGYEQKSRWYIKSIANVGVFTNKNTYIGYVMPLSIVLALSESKPLAKFCIDHNLHSNQSYLIPDFPGRVTFADICLSNGFRDLYEQANK